MAETPEETQRRKRRRRLVRGLLVGSAALGVPALLNALVAQRAKRLPPLRWTDSRSFPWRECHLAYRLLGRKGPAVVLLHSFGPGHSGLEWRAVAESLAARHRVWVPDLLGWGESDHPRVDYDDHLYIDQILDFLIDVVAEPSAVFAAGLSAAYAVQIAVDHPELLNALGLVVPLGVDLHGDEPDLKDSILHRLLRLPVLGTSALNVLTSRASIGHHLRREVFAKPDRVAGETLEQHYRASHLPGAQGPLAAYLAGYLNHDVSAILPRVDLPVWLGWGRDARAPAVESADLWLRDLAQAEIDVFESSALLPHLEQPAAVAESISDYLARRGR